MRRSVPLIVLALALAGCGGGDGDESAEETTSLPATTTAEASTGPCSAVSAPAAKPEGGQTEPSEPLDPAKTYSLVVKTNCGDFTIQLDQKQAPHTAASLVKLAEDGFFDDVTFHRVVPGFVIQGGDPTGTGAGGPGYQTVDPPPAGAAYTRGVVAMAKTQAERAGTAGSQFFVVTGADVGLPPDYAIVGKVTEGMATIDAIDALGTGDGPPSEPVVIETIAVEES